MSDGDSDNFSDEIEEFLEDEGSYNSDEDNSLNISNLEYELERKETDSKLPEDFAKFLHGCEFPDEILKYLKSLKLFERDLKTRDIIPTKSLQRVIAGFCLFLLGKKRIQKSVLRTLSKIFGSHDMYHYISAQIIKRIPSLKEQNVSSWFNISNFIAFVPHPTDKLTKPIFPQICKRSPFQSGDLKKKRNVWAANDYEKVWIAVTTGNVNSKAALKLIPFITNNVLSKLKTPFQTADFFYKMFDKKGIYAILSLGAIFKLISEHNFEYPKFYDKVYTLIRPSLLYMDHKEKVLTMLDSFLSSSHIPIYIVASFIKRLSRCLIFAPVDAQEPILGLIRNLLIRHSNCMDLVHREVPKSFTLDPYNDDEEDLHKTNALESSLWEIRLLQSHWNQGVRKRAHFIDKKLANLESYVRFRPIDDIFSMNMAKSFGGEDGEAEKYQKLQDGDDDEDVAQPVAKKFRKKGDGKYTAKHEEKVAKVVPINTKTPVSILERKMSNIDTPVLWKI